MCDCFHLAFPNWHGPGTGAGRRLRGPEREAEDDSVCEEPTEFVEGERPRPQGSSPIEEFPAAEKYAEKQGEDDFYDPLHKTSSGKKGKKVGFGSLFDKRSSGKMSQMEELQNGQSEVLVKTAKEACAEGLVVTGGGKDGIFIKEVKPDSPASKHLSVKEGDQILSATVYFDNVSYEDALQILEHAQAYKMELCLRRKAPEYPVQNDEAAQPEGEAGSPKLRGRKTKRQEARISWPKFPSFNKGRKGFKRSHSTSEAEEQRKLEMSPTTSDTESPVKSPLKSPDGKEKKKKRLKLKVKMKGLRSKSVEHTMTEEPTQENLGGVENLLEQNGTDIQSPEEMQLLVEPQVVEQEDAESPGSTKAKDEYAFPSLAEPEVETSLHKVELITLDKNLKTTDITVALAEGSPKEMRSSESVKTERSELRVNIQGKDLLDTVKESQTRSSPVSIKDQSTSIRTSDPFTYDNVVISPSVISQTDFSDHQFNVDINTPTPTSGRTETTLGHGEMDMSMPKVDVSLDMSDIGLLRKSPRIGAEKQWKDRPVNIPEPESYGIRTRGPLADMATSKVSFDAINGLQFTTSDGAGAGGVSAQQPDSDLKFKTVISQPKSSTLDISITDKNKDGTVNIKVPQTSEMHLETSIDKVLADVSTTEGKSEYKLPKVDISGTNLLDPIKLTKVDHKRVQLPNREELEIPGMEDATSTAALQIQAMKLPQIEERDTKLADEIQAKRTDIEFNLEDVKALVAKIPTFKLPRIDMSGIYTHKEITPDSDKILATAETPELSEAQTDVSLKLPDDTMEAVMIPVIDKKHQDIPIKLPNVELPHFDDHQPITVTRIEDSIQKVKSTMATLMTVESKSSEIKYKLPKREDIEIPGMEAIAKTTVQIPDVSLEVKEFQKPDTSPSHSTDAKIQIPFASAADVNIKGTALISDGKTETPPTDRKDRDKKTKKTKKSMPSFGITKPDIRFPDIGIDLPKQTTFPQKKDDSQVKVAYTKTESASDDIKTITPQAVSLDIQKPEMGIKGLSIEGEIYTSKEKGQIPEVHITTDDKKVHGTEISLPKVKESGTSVMDEPKTDITMSPAETKVVAPSADINIHVTTPEMEAVTQSTDVQGTVGETDVHESETKDTDIKLKKRKISFPKFSFSKTEVKAPEVAMTSPKASLPVTTMDTKDVEVDVTVPESGKNEGLSVEGKIEPPELEMKDEKSLKTPTFGISLPKMKGPELDIGVPTPGIDISLQEGKVEIEQKDFHVPTMKTVIDMPKVDVALPLVDEKGASADTDTSVEIEAKVSDTKLKKRRISFPKFSFSRSDSKGSDGDGEPPKVDISIDVKDSETGIKSPEAEAAAKDKSISSSPTKFKLPTLKFPKFGMSPPKVQTEGIDVDVVNTIPEEEILEVTIQGHDVTISGDVPTKEVHLTSTGDVEVKADVPQIKMETHELDTKSTEGSKLKMPKFGISLPKVKGPEISLSKTEGSVSVSEDKSEIQPDVEIKTPSLEAETDMAHLDSKETDIKFKMPKMSFPKFGLTKSEIKATETDVTPKLDISLSDGEVKIKDDSSLDITLPKTEQKMDATEANLDIKAQDVELKDSTTLSSSPSKFKLPTSKLPKIGVGATKVQADTSELITPEVKLSGVGIETTMPVSSEVTAQSIDLSASAKMPGIMGNAEKISTSKIEIDSHQPKVDIDTKISEMEKPDVKVSLSKITNEVKGSLISNNLNLPSVDLNTSKSNADIEGIEMTSGVSGEANISGKLPSFDTLKSSTDIVLPSVDVALKKSDMTIPSSEIVPPDGKKDVEIPEMNIKDPDGSPFKMPKFGISFPKVKLPDISMSGTKQDLDVSIPEGKVEVTVPDSEITAPCVDTELPQAEAKEFDAKIKKRRISFPKFGFSKPDVKAPEVDITLPKVDVSVPCSEVKEIKVDVKIPEDTELKEDTGMTSPTKFKLPSFKLPKSGTSTSKGVVEVSDIDINVKTPQVNLPETELNISGKVQALDGKGSAVEFEAPSLDTKGPEVEAEGMRVKSVTKLEDPEVHVSIPKPELDVSLPEGKVDVNVALPQGKVEMPGVDVKFKRPSFSFPKFGLSKADVKVPDVDIPEGKVEVTQPDINVKLPEGETQLKDINVTSPTKFKLPTIKFPKIGVSAPKGAVEVPTVDIDVKAPEVSLTNADLTISGDVPEIKVEGQGMDIKAPYTEAEMSLTDTEGQGSKFKLPKFGISFSNVKGPEVDVSVHKTDLDTSLPGGTADIETPFVEAKADLPDINLKDTDIKAKKPGFSFPKFGFSKPEIKGTEIDVSLPKSEVKEPEIDGKIPKESTEGKDSKSIDVKMKRPSFSFPKFGLSKPDVKAPDIDVNVPEVDMPLTEGKVEITEPDIDAEIPEGDAKVVDIHTSPSKFKLPTFKLPKIGVSAPKGSVQAPDVGIDIKASEVTLPDPELKVSTDVQEVALKGQNISTDSEEPEVDGQGRKFKLPNFGISLPTVKGPEIDVSVSKPNVDVSLPEGKVEIDGSLPEVKAEITGVDSKGMDVKVKRPGFTFPKFGWSKTDVKAPDTDVSLPEVDTSLPEGKAEIAVPQIDAKIPEGDVEYKDTNIQTSPTKFKLPTLKFPKIGVATPKGLAEAPALDINVKGAEMNLPDAELNISGKIPEVDIKGQNVAVQPPSVDISTSTGHEADGQGGKVKLPKFGISLPKVKGPEFDGSVTKPDSENERKVEVNVSLPQGKVEIPAVDSKGADVKLKRPSFSFPKFGLSKSDVKAPDIDTNLSEVDMSVPEGKVEIKGPEIDAKIPEGDKDLNIHASPTKFKLPTFKLPKIGVSASKSSTEAPELNIDVKTPDVSLPQAELKVSGDVPAANLKSQSTDAEPLSTDVHIKAEGLDVQGSKLKLPKFGISLPKVKGPEVDVSVSKPDIDISLPEGKADAEVSLPEGEIEISGVDSKSADIKIKKPSFSFPKFGFSKPDVKAPEININLPEAEMSVPEGKAEVMETEVVVQGTEGDIQLKDTSTITSPTKFKLPTFKFPKIGVSAPKGEVNVDVKAPDVSATEAELKVSMDLPNADVKGQPADVQTDGLDIEGQEGKFKVPKFGITLPKVKGPDIDVSVSKTDLDASIPEEKIDIEAPTAEVKAEILEMELDVKTKRPSFSFPKFGLSKPDVKTPHVDVTLPETDISLPESPIEVKDPGASVQVAESEVELKDTNISGSPSKFKLPTIKFPKFGITAPKVTIEIEHPDTTIKEPDMNLPDLEGKGPSSVAVTDPSVDIKATTADVNVKTKGVDVEGQESKFKLPKFGIGLPKVKGPEVNVTKTDADITLPEGDIELKVASADVERAIVKVDLPEVDSKGIDVTVKKSSFSFPKFGFSKSDKAPEVDASLPKTDISPSEVNIDVKEPKPDSEQECELKAAAISGSPSKFKLPTIKFPKFGVSVPKVESQEKDFEVRGQDVPGTELKVSEEPISIDIKVATTQRQDTDADVQTVGVGTDGQGSMFRFPKFGASLPKSKGTEVKSEGDVSLPEGKVDMEGAVEDLSVETRVDVPDVDVTAKKPGFTFPKFVFSKPNVKSSETDGKTEEADISKPEGVEIQNVSLDVKSPDRETPISSPTKFKLPTFKLPTFGGTTVKATVDITDPSLSQGIAEHVETNVKEPTSEVTPDTGKSDVDAKDVKTRISFPKLVFSKPAVKAPEVDVTLPSADMTLPEESAEVDVDVKVTETEPKGEAAVGGSPSKFKLPAIKLPKFGITTPKSAVTVPEGDSSLVMLSAETDVPVVERTVAPDIEVSTQPEDSKVLSSPSKFKLPTFKMPRLSLSKAKSEEDAETPSDVKPQEVPLEGDKENTQVTDKSPKFTFPTVQDVLRGFDVEFHVPTLDEREETKGGASQTGEEELKPGASVMEQDVKPTRDVQEKTKSGFKFTKVGLAEASKDGDARVTTDGTVTESVKKERKLELKSEQKLQDTKESPEKGSWFKFPSPTKSVKFTEREIATPREDHEQNTESENLENEISITSSVRSSDAFADESSAPTTEQIGSSLTSPTKVTVKYGQSISTGTGDVTANIITSTARTELISMDPDLPEKVNISFSSDSSSIDTLKQEAGAIHIITSNVQAIPDTQKATILSHTVQSLPVQQVIVRTTSTPWSMEETSTMQEDSMLVEKHVIKEMSGESMEKVIITQKTCMLDADSGEPNSNTTASSSQKLRDSMNKEKMLFF